MARSTGHAKFGVSLMLLADKKLSYFFIAIDLKASCEF